MPNIGKLPLMTSGDADIFESKLVCARELAFVCAECVNRGTDRPKDYTDAINGLYFYLDYLTQDFGQAYQAAIEAVNPNNAALRQEFGTLVRVLSENPDVLEALEQHRKKVAATWNES